MYTVIVCIEYRIIQDGLNNTKAFKTEHVVHLMDGIELPLSIVQTNSIRHFR